MNNMTNALTTAQGANTPATSIANYVNQYRQYARKSVENIIMLGKTVFDADRILSQKDFKAFCDEVNLDAQGPTYRKLRIIGKMSDRFKDYIDIMPNGWTTVYELAKIKDAEFEKLIECNVLNKEITSKEIKQALDPKESIRVVKNIVNLTLKLEAKNAEMLFVMEQDLHKIAERYGAVVKSDNNDLFQRWKSLNERFETAA